MEATRSITFKTASGDLKEFKCLANRIADKDSQANIVMKDADGNESIYTKELIRAKDGKEVYLYVLCDGGSNVKPQEKNLPKDKNYFWTMGDCGWDRDVDAFFDGILSIDNTKPCSDGKDDGSIGFAEGSKHFVKGVISPVKSLVKSPIKSAVIGGAVIAAGIAFPPLGVAMAAVGLVAGVGMALFGGYKAATAKTDAQAKSAWENVGTGTITAVLSFFGLKKANASLKAKQTAFPDSAKYGTPTPPSAPTPPPSTPPTTPPPAPTPAPAPTPEYSGFAKHTVEIGKKMHAVTDAAKNAYGAARNAVGSAKESVTTACKVARHPVTALDKYNIPKTAIDIKTGKIVPNRADGLGNVADYAKTAMGFFDKSGTDMSTIRALQGNVMNAVHNGHHWQAKTALSQMSQIIKGGKIGAEDLESAKTILAQCTKLTDATKFINSPPAMVPATVVKGNLDTMTDHSATIMDDIAKDAYEFAS